jgi:hypothetical protein
MSAAQLMRRYGLTIASLPLDSKAQIRPGTADLKDEGLRYACSPNLLFIHHLGSQESLCHMKTSRGGSKDLRVLFLHFSHLDELGMKQGSVDLICRSAVR